MRTRILSAIITVGALVILLELSLYPGGNGALRSGRSKANDSDTNRVMLPLIARDWCQAPSGTTYYVAPHGQDNNPGTKAMPFETIHKGIDVAKAGDIVYVRAGIYSEAINIKNSGNKCAPITISAYPGERPILDGAYSLPAGPDALCDPVSGRCFNYRAMVMVEGSYVVFEGFEIAHSRGFGIRLEAGATHNTIRNCWVHDNRYGGIMVYHSEHALIEYNRVWGSANYCTYNRPPSPLFWPGALVLSAAHHSVARGNEVFNNWGEGLTILQTDHSLVENNVIYDNLRSQLYLSRAGYTTVRRNLVYHTNAPPFSNGTPSPGITIATESKGHDGFSTNHIIVNNIVVGTRRNLDTWWQTTTHGGLNNSVIANNTFVNAVAADPDKAVNIWIEPHPGYENVRIENNIIIQNTPGKIANVADDPAIGWSHNLWSTSPPADARGPGDIIADPQLVNPSAPLGPADVNADWYKLRAFSPAIDAAKVIGEVSDDFFGRERDMNPDLGAHEYE